MTFDTIAHIMEFLASSGMLLLLWKINRMANAVWDALKTAPPHLHLGNNKIFYPPPFEKPQIAGMGNGEHEPG